MLIERLGVQGANSNLPQRLWNDYANAVLTIEFKVRDGAEAVLLSLKEAGYKIGLICNTYHTPGSVIRKILQNSGLSRYFDVLMFSDEYGVPKPKPEIFIEALSRIGVEPSEAVHVGDRSDLDMEGGKKFWTESYLPENNR